MVETGGERDRGLPRMTRLRRGARGILALFSFPVLPWLNVYLLLGRTEMARDRSNRSSAVTRVRR